MDHAMQERFDAMIREKFPIFLARRRATSRDEYLEWIRSIRAEANLTQFIDKGMPPEMMDTINDAMGEICWHGWRQRDAELALADVKMEVAAEGGRRMAVMLDIIAQLEAENKQLRWTIEKVIT